MWLTMRELSNTRGSSLQLLFRIPSPVEYTEKNQTFRVRCWKSMASQVLPLSKGLEMALLLTGSTRSTRSTAHPFLHSSTASVIGCKSWKISWGPWQLRNMRLSKNVELPEKKMYLGVCVVLFKERFGMHKSSWFILSDRSPDKWNRSFLKHLAAETVGEWSPGVALYGLDIWRWFSRGKWWCSGNESLKVMSYTMTLSAA